MCKEKEMLDFITGNIRGGMTVIDQTYTPMFHTVDEWGRTVSIQGPKEIASGADYTIRYTYAGKDAACRVSTAMTEHYDAQHPANTIKTYTYCDGLGRIVQTRKEAAVNGVEKLVVSGHTVADALGRTVASYYPTEIHKDSTRFRFITDNTAPAATATYDVMDRPLVQTAPDGSATTMQYWFDDNHLGKMLFSTTTTDANNHVSTELKDVEGKPWAVQAAGQPFVYFEYNPVGDNTKVYSAVANDWERNYTYDMLGRRLTYQEGELVESLTYNGGNLAAHSQSWLENGNTQTKTTTYHYNAHRLDSVSYDDALTTIYHYDQYGRVDSLYDESGVMCYEYGNMGEVTNETRIYALPFLSQPIALATQFTYDSWGRIQSITYPDNEVVSYAYDLGGQLQSITNNSSYTYLDNVTYDRFGAKVSQTYGNGITTDYSYNNVTRRLMGITTMGNGTPLSQIQYTYDLVGNVTQVTSSCPWLPNHSFTESFSYDASDQLTAATEMHNQSYSLSVAYGNWGKISGYTLNQKDLLHNTTQSEAQAYSYPVSGSLGDCQTLFAPEQRTITDANNNMATETLSFGINGSLRKREVQAQPQTSYTEYYLFNSAANLKAYSNNGLDFAYYGYNASNTRAYKLSMLNLNQWVNGQPFPLHFLCWLKENEAKERAFRGGEKNPVHHARQLAERRNPLRSHRSAPLSCYGRRIFSVTPQVGEMTYSNREIQRIQLWQDATVSSEVPPCNLLFSFLCFVSFIFSGRRKKERNEGKNFYYHTNHLGSTAFVTDQNQNVTQGFLYAPFGEITTEYNATFGNDIIPKYSFNAKELDEETGMYYYEARYYKPPVFTSRDPMFEKYFWMTPYAYCANNPVKYVDPNGCVPILPDPIKKSISKAITTSAEYAHALYNSAASIVQSHPQWIPMVNRSLSSIKKGVEKVTDMNPKTMGWLDLTNIWLFELGNTSEYTFGPDANTTKQLMNQEGVSQARETAYNNIKKGKVTSKINLFYCFVAAGSRGC